MTTRRVSSGREPRRTENAVSTTEPVGAVTPSGHGDEAVLYFNPDCSKCRTAAGLLKERGIPTRTVRYLSDVPSRSDLEDILTKLGTEDPRLILRTDEAIYAELGLAVATADQLLVAMVAHPILIQRPIVIRGERAVLARPPERLLELFD